MPASALTERLRALRAVVFDFDGVFTDNAVYVFEDGREAVRCYRGDGLGLRRLEQLGLALAIVSSEVNPVVTARARKLGVRCIQGSANKHAALADLLAEWGLAFEQAAFVGNDLNDLPCLQAVGVPMVVADAHPAVAPYAAYQTQTRGGYGAVREVADLIASARAGHTAAPALAPTTR